MRKRHTVLIERYFRSLITMPKVLGRLKLCDSHDRSFEDYTCRSSLPTLSFVTQHVCVSQPLSCFLLTFPLLQLLCGHTESFDSASQSLLAGQALGRAFHKCWHVSLQRITHILLENGLLFWIKILPLSAGWVLNVRTGLKKKKKIIMKQDLVLSLDFLFVRTIPGHFHHWCAKQLQVAFYKKP